MDTNIEYNQEYKAYKIPKIYSFLGFKYCKVDEVNNTIGDLLDVLLEISRLKEKLRASVVTMDLLNYSIEEFEDYKEKLLKYYLVFNIADYLYKNSEDIRMEELILNLEEQMLDNQQWVREFLNVA